MVLKAQETTVPSSCVVCKGDVHLKVTDGQALAFCPTCHYVARPLLDVLHDRLRLRLAPVAQA